MSRDESIRDEIFRAVPANLEIQRIDLVAFRAGYLTFFNAGLAGCLNNFQRSGFVVVILNPHFRPSMGERQFADSTMSMFIEDVGGNAFRLDSIVDEMSVCEIFSDINSDQDLYSEYFNALPRT